MYTHVYIHPQVYKMPSTLRGRHLLCLERDAWRLRYFGSVRDCEVRFGSEPELLCNKNRRKLLSRRVVVGDVAVIDAAGCRNLVLRFHKRFLQLEEVCARLEIRILLRNGEE